MSTLNAFDALRYIFQGNGLLSGPFEKVPLLILQLNWAKAKKINIDSETFSHDEAWKVIREIGLEKQAVLPLIDPAIAQIVDRLMDFPVLPIACCSGHSWEVPGKAWMTLIFQHPEFGRQFLERCRSHADMAGVRFEENAYIARTVGSFGPRVPAEDCIRLSLPLTLSCDFKDLEECQRFWLAVSWALSDFDQKGQVVISPKDFDLRVEDDDRHYYLQEVWNSLFWGEAK